MPVVVAAEFAVTATFVTAVIIVVLAVDRSIRSFMVLMRGTWRSAVVVGAAQTAPNASGDGYRMGQGL